MSVHCCPRLLMGGGAVWVECWCKWRSPMYRRAQDASYAWALHVRHVHNDDDPDV